MLNAKPDSLGRHKPRRFSILPVCHHSVKLDVVRRSLCVVRRRRMPLAYPNTTLAEQLRRDAEDPAIQNGEAPESTGEPQ